MIFVAGGAFRVGLDDHHPEQTPAQRVTVDPFRIDRTPVANREFRRLVSAAGDVTFVQIPPDPKGDPGAIRQ
jgi:formylglycine-generating enzyme required for sulfatase activity